MPSAVTACFLQNQVVLVTANTPDISALGKPFGKEGFTPSQGGALCIQSQRCLAVAAPGKSMQGSEQLAQCHLQPVFWYVWSLSLVRQATSAA